MKSEKLTKKNSRLRLCIIWSVMGTVILVLWALLTLPIVFYNLSATFTSNFSLNQSSYHEECLIPLQYNNGVCFDSLKLVFESQECDVSDINSVPVAADREMIAGYMLNKLTLINSSSECKRRLLSFICLYVFDLCGLNNEIILPTKDECEDIQYGSCSEEWNQSITLGINKPDCSLFSSNLNLPCPPGDDEITSTLTCQKHFFMDPETQHCIPNCQTWSQYGEFTTRAVRISIIVSGCVGILLAIAALTVSICRHKAMFEFPSIFLVYSTLNVLVLDFFIVLGSSNVSLLCSSRSFVDGTETAFCVINGIAFSYLIVQLGLWWMFHLSVLFWSVWFPFHYQKFKNNGQIKYIHIILLLVGLIMPLTVIISTMADFARAINEDSQNMDFLSGGLGFSTFNNPPIVCTPAYNIDVAFYAMIFPLDLIIGVGSLLAILILYGFYKNNKLVGTAEKKLFLVLGYNMLLTVFAILSFTIIFRNGEAMLEAIVSYFNCEANGLDPNNPCLREFEQFNSPVTLTLNFVILTLYPFYVLVFVVKVEAIKKFFKKIPQSSLKSESVLTNN